MDKKKEFMTWWNKLTLEEKFYEVIFWLKKKGWNVTDRHPDSLTEKEIEEIFKIKNQ